ncbi:MAG TPA: threonine synthase [Methylovirgula sp.]|nr:threonine synthase [Methylovirgula sp.]
MKYISTRGEAPSLNFTDALIAGLAQDGGLYLPEAYPQLSAAEIAGFAGKPYAQVAEAVIAPFVGDALERKYLRAAIEAAYALFDHAAVAPLSQIGDNLFLLELFHGPTLAFKDLAMQVLSRLMRHVLAARGKRATILGATSGDTGAAAIAAFRGIAELDLFILYPHERISDVQRRQMTTIGDANTHVVAIEGTFDDAQALVKALFANKRAREEFSLAGVNSINWARVVAQAVYYFTSAVALGAPHRAVSFAVPTGNFGDILAGWIAKRMGLPIERLVIATNANDILARALATGRYEVGQVQATQSPSMDIQVSSNFERLLFEACGRDPAAIRRAMAALQQAGSFGIEPGPLAAIRAEFDAVRIGEAETTGEIARVWRETQKLIDPHTAVAVGAARAALAKHPAIPMVVLGTAHPAKFPSAILRATNIDPPLPAHLADLASRREHYDVLARDEAVLESFIRGRLHEAERAAAS